MRLGPVEANVSVSVQSPPTSVVGRDGLGVLGTLPLAVETAQDEGRRNDDDGFYYRHNARQWSASPVAWQGFMAEESMGTTESASE